jgi:hypothetical protein
VTHNWLLDKLFSEFKSILQPAGHNTAFSAIFTPASNQGRDPPGSSEAADGDQEKRRGAASAVANPTCCRRLV